MEKVKNQEPKVNMNPKIIQENIETKKNYR